MFAALLMKLFPLIINRTTRRGLFAVLGGIYAEVAAHVAAEVGGGGEPEHVGNLNYRQVLVAQKARYLQRCVAVYPVVGGVAAHTFRHFGKVFGGYAEGVGIVRSPRGDDGSRRSRAFRGNGSAAGRSAWIHLPRG